jgi:hypothetical protein
MLVAMNDTSVCPGCGVVLAVTGWTLDREMNASPGCWQVYGEVSGFELSDPALVGRFHQLAVDAYGAQHTGDDPRAIRVAYSLVGLHLALDRGVRGVDVRAAHQRMGRPDPTWPEFVRPSSTGDMTVLDVAVAGARAGSIEGHADAMRRWADAVWAAWADVHTAVAALTDRLVPERFR